MLGLPRPFLPSLLAGGALVDVLEVASFPLAVVFAGPEDVAALVLFPCSPAKAASGSIPSARLRRALRTRVLRCLHFSASPVAGVSLKVSLFTLCTSLRVVCMSLPIPWFLSGPSGLSSCKASLVFIHIQVHF